MLWLVLPITLVENIFQHVLIVIRVGKLLIFFALDLLLLRCFLFDVWMGQFFPDVDCPPNPSIRAELLLGYLCSCVSPSLIWFTKPRCSPFDCRAISVDECLLSVMAWRLVAIHTKLGWLSLARPPRVLAIDPQLLGEISPRVFLSHSLQFGFICVMNLIQVDVRALLKVVGGNAFTVRVQLSIWQIHGSLVDPRGIGLLRLLRRDRRENLISV